MAGLFFDFLAIQMAIFLLQYSITPSYVNRLIMIFEMPNWHLKTKISQMEMQLRFATKYNISPM